MLTRRVFLQQIGVVSVAATIANSRPAVASETPIFKISLAEWSFNRALFGKKMDHLDFPKIAKQEYGIEAIELVNQFFMKKAKSQKYLAELKKRADDQGVRILLIMCDDEGSLGHPDAKKRKQAVENHYQWADAAKFFGCHSIRVNAETEGVGSLEEQQKRVAEGLRQLCEYTATLGLNVIVENHGSASSDGAWIAGVMKLVNLPNCGTLPDFGNFYEHDRYQGVRDMMPFAKGVSAKSHDFDAQGNEVHTDYRKMLRIVTDAGYHGHLGIEYEGNKHPESEGVRLTKALIERVMEEIAERK
jgi:L-ribulose-5-phosphate 3-epimerase